MPDIREIPLGNEQVDATAVAERLEELRAVLRSETISYAELSELQSLAPSIDPSDVELLEAAGVPEVTPSAETQRAYRLRLFDRQVPGRYFADGAVFSSTEEARLQLISYHSQDSEEPETLEQMSLQELLDYGEWEVEVEANPAHFDVRPATDAELYAIAGAMDAGLAQSYGLSGSTAERARGLAELAYCVCIPSYSQSHPGYSGKLWLLVPMTLADGAAPTNFIEGEGGKIVQI